MIRSPKRPRMPRWAALALLTLAAVVIAPSGWAQDEAVCRLGDPNADHAIVPGCSVGSDGRLRLSSHVAQQLRFDADGLSVLLVKDQYYYVRADGSSLPVILSDNGPDAFTEGLTRGVFHGRIGFYDLRLREVVPPVHGYAWPFANGVARVCDGCRPGTPDINGYTPMQGGRWYYIDRRNREVAQPQH